MNSLARTAHDISSGALGWLHANRAYTAFSSSPSAHLVGADDTYKALNETALAASLAVRTGATGAGELTMARELLDFCWVQMNEGMLLYERLLRYPFQPDPLETYACFARAGYRHPPLERLCTHTASLRSSRASELVPNRRLAVANAARVTGLDLGADTHDWTALTRSTWLAGLPEPWHIDWNTGYSVTHTVFHLTDWGRVPGGLPADMAGYLHDWLPVWTDIWTEVAQWDLIGELLIAGNCLPEPCSDPADWERLAAVQHGDGMLPRDDEPVADDPERRFHDHQHPTIVAAITGLLGLSRALDEPATTP